MLTAPSSAIADLSVETRRPFHFFMAVWGEPYIDCFLNVALPSLLAEGNLPAFYEIKNSEFVFITSLRDKARLSESESIANLGSQISIRYILFDPSTFSHAHAALVEAHRLAADKAHREGARVIVLCPDMILSAGSLAHVMKIADRGKRAIMVAGLRLTTETATGPLRARLGKRDLSILEPRKLLTFAMDHFHPQTKKVVKIRKTGEYGQRRSKMLIGCCKCSSKFRCNLSNRRQPMRAANSVLSS